MNSSPLQACHIVVLPYPGRGHINPILSFCKLLLSPTRNQKLRITIIVTEEWLSLLSSSDKPTEAVFATIPNVLPSEKVRGADHSGFLEAVSTKMEGAVERVLDDLEGPFEVIVADTFLPWAPDIGRRRNVPVASFWPQSASAFSAFYHHELVVENQHYPIDFLGERAEDRVDYIPGVSSIRLVDLPESFHSYKERTLRVVIEVMSALSKVQFIIFGTLDELEVQVIDALKLVFPTTLIHCIGTAIKLSEPTDTPYLSSTDHSDGDYRQWLNSQQEKSVLYVSLGSYLSASREQLKELAAGLCESGVPFLWPAREETEYLRGLCGEKGMIVEWCDQLTVLNHKSVAGFLTHCGWNSILESASASVPVLTFPLLGDQTLNSKLSVEDWKIGWRLKERVEKDGMIKKDKVKLLVSKFMDIKSSERKKLDICCKRLQEVLRAANTGVASANSNVDRFLSDILEFRN